MGRTLPEAGLQRAGLASSLFRKLYAASGVPIPRALRAGGALSRRHTMDFSDFGNESGQDGTTGPCLFPVRRRPQDGQQL